AEVDDDDLDEDDDDEVSAEVDDDDLDEDDDDEVSAEVDDDDLDEDEVSAEVDDEDLDDDDDDDVSSELDEDDDDSIGSKYEEAYGFSAPTEDDAFDAQEVMDETPGVVIEDSISSLPDDDQSPLDSIEVPDDSGTLLEDELVPSVPTAPTDNAVPAALAGKAPAPPANDNESKVLSEEDPLAKLVREAMQRAVDNARGEEG
ncbi:MAG: hypothetical protein ACR2NL_08575, partial [Acidimicrobiia bacterium]